MDERDHDHRQGTGMPAEHGAAGAHSEPSMHEGEEEEHIHLPGPSWYPFTLAASLTVAMIGLVSAPHFSQPAGAGHWTISIVIAVIGAIGMGWSIIAWGIEVSEA